MPGKRDGRNFPYGVVNICSVDISLGESQIEGLQKSLVFLSPRYSQRMTSLEPFLKLKISGPCKWNEYQPQTHEKTHVYKVSKERLFFHPDPRPRHKRSLILSTVMDALFFSSLLFHYSLKCPALCGV